MFISLHNHSHYSLLDGLPKIDDYIKKAVEFGMPALALTDHGVMYGVIEFYQKCLKANIKPIIGCEVYLAPRALQLKHYGVDEKNSHLILLAKNEEGYRNLMFLSTVAHLDGFYYKPRIDKKILKEKASGLIATSACLNGEIPKALRNNNLWEAEKLLKEYQEIFGPENFFLELEYIGAVKEQLEVNEKLIALAKKTGAPMIAARDTHYISDEDKIAQDVLVCVQTGKTLDDQKRLNMTGADLSFIQPEKMAEFFKAVPEAIINTERIAAMVELKLELGKLKFPQFPLPENIDPNNYLEKISWEGLNKKIPGADEETKKRLAYELEVINKKCYAPYFLIVSDLIKFAREHSIPTTTRGSAAGSLVSYTVDITTLNPLDYGLPFERFLNPFRPSPPDIDMDFADNRREEVVEYARQKYGHEKVANIATFGTMMARGSVRDVTRVLGLPYEFGDKIAKLIPFGAQGMPMTINKALGLVPELENIYKNNTDAQKVIDLAKKIEGSARHVSVHAAGVVIAPDILTNYTPLQKDPSVQRNIITQYEMHACEEVGLVKMDFLGIRNLSILGEAVKIIEKTKGIKIDLEQLPLNDKKTFDFIAAGHTFGMFQLGGTGMTKWLMELKPTSVKEIMAMVALFRPGPMESIPEFIARKQGKKKIEYLDPKLEPILKDTYGVITYQDDLLLIAINIAGYNWETVDKFRKAVGKKIPELMAEQEKIFIEGCQKHSNFSLEKALALWQLFDPFKGYGFNKAHAASYALVAYQTAYLKAHYPSEFMTAVMTAEYEDLDKIAEAVQECQNIGIRVLPPDINHSRPDFTYLSDQEIIFGLLAIKNLGADIAKAIIDNRKKEGQFKSLNDFLKRVNHKNLNKKSLEALIKSGAMDSLGERNQTLQNMDVILNFIRQRNKPENNNGQASLFGSLPKTTEERGVVLEPAPPADLKTKLIWEKELLGLYVSGHPFSETEKMVAEKITHKCGEIATLKNAQKVAIAGLIIKVQKILTRQQEPMAFAIIADSSAEIELVIFPETFKSTTEIWQNDKKIFVIGQTNFRDDKPKVAVNEVFEITQETWNEKTAKIKTETIKNVYVKNGNEIKVGQKRTIPSELTITRIWITLPKFFNSNIHQKLKNIFDNYPGETKVFLKLNQSGVWRKIETDFKIFYRPEIGQKLEEIVGSGNIKTE
ncbi:MAG TPA: DNA polymerase III subunit alpha [bacterium]|nr:DNA polymerase III subunit alpha [bacterium]HPL95491.1 DNA polymerase III subunit alpha [bacterium]